MQESKNGILLSFRYAIIRKCKNSRINEIPQLRRKLVTFQSYCQLRQLYSPCSKFAEHEISLLREQLLIGNSFERAALIAPVAGTAQLKRLFAIRSKTRINSNSKGAARSGKEERARRAILFYERGRLRPVRIETIDRETTTSKRPFPRMQRPRDQQTFNSFEFRNLNPTIQWKFLSRKSAGIYSRKGRLRRNQGQSRVPKNKNDSRFSRIQMWRISIFLRRFR